MRGRHTPDTKGCIGQATDLLAVTCPPTGEFGGVIASTGTRPALFLLFFRFECCKLAYVQQLSLHCKYWNSAFKAYNILFDLSILLLALYLTYYIAS